MRRGYGRAVAVASCSWLRSAEPDRPAGRAFLLLARPPQCLGRPGLGSAGVPARPGLAPAGGPAAWPVACSPCCAQGLGGRGPEGLARSPRAHTPSGGLLSAGDDGRGHQGCECARVCGIPYPAPSSYFPRGGPGSSWLQGTPTFGVLKESGEIIYEISACLETAGSDLRRHARLPNLGQTDLPGYLPSFFFFFFYQKWGGILLRESSVVSDFEG